VFLIPFHGQSAVVPCETYLTRVEVLNVVTLGWRLFGVTKMSVEVCWRYETRGMPPDTTVLASPHQASLFNITDFYHCDLMPTSKISANATEWGPHKNASNRAPHVLRPALCTILLCACRARLRGDNGGNWPGPPLQGAPRNEIYLFQIKYLFEKFGVSKGIQEYNSI